MQANLSVFYNKKRAFPGYPKGWKRPTKFDISTVIDSRGIMEENCFGDCFTISDPAHPESYLFGGNSLLYDTDTISTIGFCT